MCWNADFFWRPESSSCFTDPSSPRCHFLLWLSKRWRQTQPPQSVAQLNDPSEGRCLQSRGAADPHCQGPLLEQSFLWFHLMTVKLLAHTAKNTNESELRTQEGRTANYPPSSRVQGAPPRTADSAGSWTSGAGLQSLQSCWGGPGAFWGAQSRRLSHEVCNKLFRERIGLRPVWSVSPVLLQVTMDRIWRCTQEEEEEDLGTSGLQLMVLLEGEVCCGGRFRVTTPHLIGWLNFLFGFYWWLSAETDWRVEIRESLLWICFPVAD